MALWSWSDQLVDVLKIITFVVAFQPSQIGNTLGTIILFMLELDSIMDWITEY